ncbi:MAG: hypothetical protein JO023_25995 [Chloroflexi bacterium]|nr:hypothetical protein [Chloroflexota bacterium]
MSESGSAPALKKLDLTIARLRLLLADIASRDASLDGQRRTALEQRNKLVTFSLYGDSSLDSVLTMMADVDERLAHVEASRRNLSAIRERAELELESLQLTKRVEEAKAQLAETRDEAEIARLQQVINDSSERAAQTIQDRFLKRSR